MINVDKLFPRLSIRAKLVIAFSLFGVVPVAVVGGYGAVHSFLLLNDAIQDRLKAGVAMKAEDIQRFLDGVKDDVLFLSRLPTLRALVNLPPTARERRRHLVPLLGEEFLALARSRPAYYQLRYIDDGGREVVRADFDGQRRYLVPSDQLQDKGDRYYFREAMKTPPGAIYVSPMDLNIEEGSVEVPHKPVVRYAVSLRSDKGASRGIVIVNIYAAHILRQVLALGQGMGDVSLASSAGYYLSRSAWIRAGPASSGSGSPPFPSWLASYSERTQVGPDSSTLGLDERLSQAFPSKLVATMLSGKVGTVVEPGLRGRIVAFAPISPRQEGHGELWILLHAYPKSQVLSSTRFLQVLVLVLGGGVLVLALGLGIAAARHFTRPIAALIRGAEAVAAGDFHAPIRVETNDELEDLSRHFTTMANHLEGHERQLQEARERAERKTQETQALNRIGMEVLALLSLPQILQLVVDKARELMKGDLAILCLSAPGEGLRLGAVSGATEALRLGPGDPLPALNCENVVHPAGPCPAIAGAAFPSHVAVVMRSGDRVVGNLCVASRESRPVSPEEVEFLSGLANQAAIAIENARLHREVRDLARLEERGRIGQDLHDGIIQAIYATGLGLEECVRLTEEDPREVKPKLEAAIESLNTVIRDVRNYIVGLQPEELQDRSLGRALDELARGLTLNAILTPELAVEDGIDRALNPDQAIHLFHICREALANVVRHAGASRVALALRRENGILLLSVEDDGVGFDPGGQASSGQGLHNMGERARRLGGELAVTSAPGHGTRIAVRLPLEPQP